MLQVRTRGERGHTRIDWLESWHTFSFGEYYDPENRGFSDLRVINDDIVAPGKGFETHPHRDMEIITYILSGTLAHKDSMGNGSLIRPGDVQRMTAGTGVLHSEFNPSDTDPVHLLQIWILPECKGLEPGYEQKSFSQAEKRRDWCLIASRQGQHGSVVVHQDVNVYATLLSADERREYRLPLGRACWVHVATGSLQLNGKLLEAGDGVGVVHEEALVFEGLSRETDLLLFDLREPGAGTP